MLRTNSTRIVLVLAIAVMAAGCATAGDRPPDPDAAGGNGSDAGGGVIDAGGGGNPDAAPCADADNDGVCDAADVCPGSDDGVDSDNDGVPNGCDVCAGFDDAVDTDNDTVPDGCDICAGFDDAIDSDNDTVPDGCDICAGFDDAIDSDNDAVPDGCDLCEGFDDAIDTNNNGVPDACEGVCDPLTDVSYQGKCYYLDGSRGLCDAGYSLAPQSVLSAIAGQFVGKDYKNQVSDNCCIVHANQAAEGQDWGMETDCNAAGPFVQGPILGGAGCTDQQNDNVGQLTFCMSSSAMAGTIDLTPTTGTLIETDDPYWASKGYQFTADQTINVTAFQWWINLPSSATVAARLYNSVGTLLASGTAVAGLNAEQWYSSAISYTLQAGQVYTLSMYHSVASTGTFDRRDSPAEPFVVSPYVSGVYSRSNCGAVTQSDEYPDCMNTWAPYQRIIAGP